MEDPEVNALIGMLYLFQNAYAVVATGETAMYGNIILKKGVIA